MSPSLFQYHPDRFRAASPSEAESALKKFLEIDAAWRILKEQDSRRRYDLQLRGGWTGSGRRSSVPWTHSFQNRVFGTSRTVFAPSAQTLTQDWPLESAVRVEDMSWDGGERWRVLVRVPSACPPRCCRSRQPRVHTPLSLWRSFRSPGGGAGGGAAGGGRRSAGLLRHVFPQRPRLSAEDASAVTSRTVLGARPPWFLWSSCSLPRYLDQLGRGFRPKQGRRLCG